MLKAARLHQRDGTLPARETFMHIIPSAPLVMEKLWAVFLPHSPLCTLHIPLKSCFQEYSANSSENGYVYISK